MDAIPLFVELCAGTAALTLRLAHPKARPPVSRLGAKTGYADAILRCMGLRPGGGFDHAIFCEPDPGCRLLLHAYRDRALALAAAEIIRGWKDEEPRALWERLRAEGPARCEGGAREVARWLVRSTWSYEQGNVKTGFVGPGDRRQDTTATATATATARIAGLVGGATIAPDARQTLPVPPLPEGTVVYADVPYQGTTSYAHLFPRSEWLPIVRAWKEAGALVVVSEAEPIPDLMGEGWHEVEITGERKGQKRTFGGTREFLTMSRPPAWKPARQVSLFGGFATHDTGRAKSEEEEAA